jgi:hypothetical protein
MSTTLADQLKVTKVQLEKPLPIQLAVQGSRTKANWGTVVDFGYQDIESKRYFDIINLDNYDLILGTPFLYQHKVVVGLNHPRISIGSREPLPMQGEQVTTLASRAMDLHENDLDEIRESLVEYASDLFKDVIDTPLPPLRDINHTIPLIDENKVLNWRPSKCPEPLRHLWGPKRDAYIKTGRWRIHAGPNASPMLLLRKPDPPGSPARLRTVFDLRERNANTVKVSSQMPDMEMILARVSRRKYWSLIDLKDAYEQIRIVPEHVNRSIFNTPDGTMVSEVLQQGDCNAPATYQAVMNHIFAPYIGVCIDPYLDDICIYSDSIEEHIKHIKIAIDILRREKLYISKEKMKLFVRELKLLGHIIDLHGVRMNPVKVDSVLNWKTPVNQDLLRGFLGAVGYLAPGAPNIRVPMGHLARLTGDTVPFRWTETEQRAFEQVKELVHQY